ncbi:MAG: type II toxin-antitoxin system RelE/ParE family toxin [Parcubacteria group bacterium]|nr:type II toxin-antitoxin system RelE/ParE family toxin [Parcubacteria group bacterium]
MYTISLHKEVIRTDIPKLSKSVRERMDRVIQEKLMTSPEIFGKPLLHSLKGYRKLRVGDYRIVFAVRESKVYIVMIRHRSKSYDSALQRRIYDK